MVEVGAAGIWKGAGPGKEGKVRGCEDIWDAGTVLFLKLGVKNAGSIGVLRL